MLFRMDEQVFTGEEVTSAVLKIYIKTKGKRRRRRIILHVSENTEDGNLAEFATIKLRVKRKGWQKINLPVYLLNKLQHQPIKLHVGCEKCNKKVRVVLPLKKSKKSQELRDLGSRKRRSPIIVLNTKPNSAAAAAVAAVVATRHLRRPRRDIFRLGSRGPFPEIVSRTIEQSATQINTDPSSSKQLHSSLFNIGSVDKSVNIAQRKDRNVRETDEGVRKVSKRSKTTRSTCTESGVTDVNNNNKNENKSPARNNHDSSIDDNDDDDDYDNSSFEYDDDNDDDGDDNEEEEDYEKKAQGYDNTMGKYESGKASAEENDPEKNEEEGLTRGCCMTSRFVSFKSIGLSGLVVRPRLGFVSNQCSDFCPKNRPHPTAKADVENRDTVVASQENRHINNLHQNKLQEVADFSPPKYTDQPKTWLHPSKENSNKSLLDKLTSSPNSKLSSEHVRVRPSFTLQSNLHQTRPNHSFRNRNNRFHRIYHNSDRERQDTYNKRRWNRNDVDNKNNNGEKNSNTTRKDGKGKNFYKKNIPPRRLCRPVEYKNLKLSFITADMKVEKMTLPNAIVSKCGYVW